jgi:hypothetical protein
LKALLFLAILLVPVVWVDLASNVHAVSAASIPTEGGTWADPTITVVINPQLSQPWFKASYSVDVSRAISRWTESIIAYTDTYGSSYLRKLSFLTYVAGNQSLPANPDIQVNFIQSFGSTQTLGVTSTKTTTTGNVGIFLAPTTTTLATNDPTSAIQLTDTDMINIASHEFGHALGLDHATAPVTDDGTFELMFRSYGQVVGSSRNTLEAPSTLDLFALSYVYDWLATSSTLNGSGHPVTNLVLPSGVSYSSVYPYPEQIQMLQNSVDQLKLEIIILAIVTATLLALVLALAILLSRKKPAPPAPYPWGLGSEPSNSLGFRNGTGLLSRVWLFGGYGI